MATAKKTPKTAKPKKLSKTKQELRRLREFVAMFVPPNGRGITIPLETLSTAASQALTGKTPRHLSNHDAVAADVARLNAMGPKGLEKFLAGK